MDWASTGERGDGSASINVLEGANSTEFSGNVRDMCWSPQLWFRREIKPEKKARNTYERGRVGLYTEPFGVFGMRSSRLLVDTRLKGIW